MTNKNKKLYLAFYSAMHSELKISNYSEKNDLKYLQLPEFK